MGYKLITAPTLEPISLDEIKRDLRIDHADDDDTLRRMMVEARQFVETRLELKLLTQTWDYIIDAFPTNEIRLPFGPVQTITQLAYDDESGMQQTLPPTEYYLDNASKLVVPEPWIFPTAGWPVTLDAVNAVRIRFVCGYESAELVPGEMRAAFRYKMRELYDGDDTRELLDTVTWNVQSLNI